MIFYTVDTNITGFPVRYIDQAGLQQSWPDTFQDAGEALREFEAAHPGAYYLTFASFNRKLEALAIDRAKLAAWQRWARPAGEMSKEGAECLKPRQDPAGLGEG